MNNEYIEAYNNLENAQKKYTKVYNSVVENLSEMRYKSMDFYNRLSLLSGGILSLSITFIGYLSSIPNFQVNYAELLFGGWVFLLITVISGMYRNHFNLNMGHYQVTTALNEAHLKSEEASLTMMEKFPQSFVDIRSSDVLTSKLQILRNNVELIKKAIQTGIKKNEQNVKLWATSEKVTHVSFVLGLLLITLFASLNLPVKINFNILDITSKSLLH